MHHLRGLFHQKFEKPNLRPYPTMQNWASLKSGIIIHNFTAKIDKYFLFNLQLTDANFSQIKAVG